MTYYLREMRREDIPQVNEIDREAFPTQWPPPDYRRELQNPLARLLVVYDNSYEVGLSPESVSGALPGKKRWWQRLFGGGPPQSGEPRIIGFASIWILADEAHITNIAVRQSYQRRGIGELLLMSIIDLATELKVSLLTLEVRVSNMPAQKLYRKHGFVQTGLRRGYYTDNHEDALLMSTESLSSAPFQVQLQQLKRAHTRRYGKMPKSLTEKAAA